MNSYSWVWTIYTYDLIIMLKVCIEPTTLFSDNRGIACKVSKQTSSGLNSDCFSLRLASSMTPKTRKPARPAIWLLAGVGSLHAFSKNISAKWGETESPWIWTQLLWHKRHTQILTLTIFACHFSLCGDLEQSPQRENAISPSWSGDTKLFLWLLMVPVLASLKLMFHVTHH